MHLLIGGGFAIAEIEDGDKAAYVEHLNERQIFDQTLNIPFPYTEADADFWIRRVAAEAQEQGRSLSWAIRREDGHLVGGIGYHDLVLGKTHRAELGYWLAKPYWGRGIMTRAVERVTDWAFAELGLIRVTAQVFHFNVASARVLEKAGFQREGLLRKHDKKEDRFLDTLLYSKINDV